MLTIGFSSHLGEIKDKKFIKHLKDTVGIHPSKYEIINIQNFDEYSLAEVYNKILNKAKFDVVLLVHNDVIFRTKGWGTKLLSDIKKNGYGIMGLAGSTELKKEQEGCWWKNIKNTKGLHDAMVGRVWHKNNGHEYESNYGKKDNGCEDAVLIDGVFIAIDKRRIKHNFDEKNFSGYHFYDLSFCLPNFIDNVKIGVTYNIKLTHLSIGQVNEQWHKNKELFFSLYNDEYKVNKNMIKPKIKLFDVGLPITIVVPLSEKRKEFFEKFVYPSLEWSDAKEIIVDENIGTASEKRNNGAKYSTQPYIIFIDDDIIIPIDFLEKLYKVLKNNGDKAFSYTDYKGIVMKPETHPLKNNFHLKSREFDSNLLKQNNYISTMSLIDKKYFDGFDENLKRLQDWDLWLSILKKYNKEGIYVKDTYFIAFYNDDGITSKNNITYEDAKREVLKKY